MKNLNTSVEIRSIGYKNQTKPLLFNTNLKLDYGSIYGLFAPTGTGKTSLLNALAGLSSNYLKVDMSIQGFNQIDVGLIPQQPRYTFAPTLPVGKVLSDLLQSQHSKLTLEELIHFAGLEDKQILKQYPHQCSGGEIQRIAFACCLAKDSKIILADEPTTSVDEETAHILLSKIRDSIGKDGWGIISSHEPHILNRYCDKIYQLENGQLRLFEPSQIPSPKYNSIRSSMPSHTSSIFFLNIDDFRYGRQKKPLLYNISWDIQSHSIYGLSGKSGSGKSTLAKLLLKKIEKVYSKEEAALYQYIPQDPIHAFHPKMSMRKQLSPILKKWREGVEIEQYISIMGLPEHLLDRNIFQLSGGQRQQFLIARALIVRPKLLILDESFNGLDVKSKTKVLAWLKEYLSPAVSLIIISHQRKFLDQIVDFSIELEEGSLLFLK